MWFFFSNIIFGFYEADQDMEPFLLTSLLFSALILIFHGKFCTMKAGENRLSFNLENSVTVKENVASARELSMSLSARLGKSATLKMSDQALDYRCVEGRGAGAYMGRVVT